MASADLKCDGELKKRFTKRYLSVPNSSANLVKSEDSMRRKLPEALRDKIIRYFESGKYAITEIAVACGITYKTAWNYLNNDPELKEKYETAFNARLDQVLEAMTERAIDGRNEIAAQQAGEFLLRHHRKQQYSNDTTLADAAKALPKIVIPMVVNRTADNSLPSVETMNKVSSSDVVIDVDG